MAHMRHNADYDVEDEDLIAALALWDPRALVPGARWRHEGGTYGDEDHWLLFDTNGRLLTCVTRVSLDPEHWYARGGSMVPEDDGIYEISYYREPTFDNAIEWEQAVIAAHPVDDLCVGDDIMCRYSDGRMYPATICFGLGQGRYEIRWKDDDDDECGETWNQPLSNIRLIERA